MLKEAQTLAEKKTRSKGENDKLGQHLKPSREQLQTAEMLGYAKKKDYKTLYKGLDEIKKNQPVARAIPDGSTVSKSSYLTGSDLASAVAIP